MCLRGSMESVEGRHRYIPNRPLKKEERPTPSSPRPLGARCLPPSTAGLSFPLLTLPPTAVPRRGAARECWKESFPERDMELPPTAPSGFGQDYNRSPSPCEGQSVGSPGEPGPLPASPYTRTGSPRRARSARSRTLPISSSVSARSKLRNPLRRKPCFSAKREISSTRSTESSFPRLKGS